MNSNLESILEPQESIVWQGVMSRRILTFNLALWLILTIAFSIFVLANSSVTNPIYYLVFSVLLIAIILKFLADYVKIFFITNKRVIIKSGIIGTDYNSIYYTNIKTANVRVDLIEKLFGVGTINIDTGKIETITTDNKSHTQTAYDQFLYIEEPYEVYKTLQVNLSSRQESLYSGRADIK